MQNRLQQQELLTGQDTKQLEDEIAAEISDAVRFTENGTLEPVAELARFVYSEKPGE